MKKIIAVFEIIALIMCFTACGGKKVLKTNAATSSTAKSTLVTATATSTVTATSIATPTATKSAEELKKQKEKEIIEKFNATDKYCTNAKQFDQNVETKITKNEDGADKVWNSKSSYKSNITDKKSEFYYSSTYSSGKDSSTKNLIYAENTAYYNKGDVKIKSEISSDKFMEVEKEMLEADIKEDFNYNNFKAFTYEELNDKYKGTFKSPDATAIKYYQQLMIESFKEGYDSIISCTINSILIESTIYKKGYYESKTEKIDFTFEVKEKGSQEKKKIKYKLELIAKLVSIDKEVSISKPADYKNYSTTDNILVSSEYDDKLYDYIIGTYDSFKMSKIRNIDISGGSKYSFKEDLVISADFNNDKVSKLTSKGTINYNGDTHNYSENYDGKTYSYTDGDQTDSYAVESKSIDSYLSAKVRGCFYMNEYSNIKVENSNSGYTLSADVNGDMVENLAYDTIDTLFQDPENTWKSVVDTKCSSFTCNIIYNKNDEIISLEYYANFTISFEDEDIIVKYKYITKYLDKSN